MKASTKIKREGNGAHRLFSLTVDLTVSLVHCQEPKPRARAQAALPSSPALHPSEPPFSASTQCLRRARVTPSDDAALPQTTTSSPRRL
ncbi:hypothetical protein M0R45_008747 [Rubus argutus]|uniref:Uncharacterized protein n=1 Tax=Rubus argutus TaxID=59490 RepID=A0AAW1Y311_RUBAR